MKTQAARLLLVEDDETLRTGLAETLTTAGYRVLTAATGDDGLRQAVESQPDILLLDVMLPGISGYEICRKLRDQGRRVPVILLTARQDEFDKLHGFEMGADDYVTKPFSLKELLARIAAVLARSHGAVPSAKREYVFGSYVVDLESRALRRRARRSGARRAAAPGEEWDVIDLTRTEFDLLAYFCANPGKALDRETLMRDVWGQQYLGTQRSIDSFVAAVRGKIEDNPREPVHILTVHGVGYKFDPGPSGR